MPRPDESCGELARRLAQRSDAELRDLLALRADVLRGPVPRSFPELAGRLLHPASVLRAVGGLTAPLLQTLAAVSQAGAPVVRADVLTALLAGDDPVVGGAVGDALRELERRALLAAVDGGWEVPDTVSGLFEGGFGLGPNATSILAEVNADGLKRLCRLLDLHPDRQNRATLEPAVLARWQDPEWVRRRLATAPAAVLRWLADDPGGHPSREVGAWLASTGLAVQPSWGYELWLAAEVRLAALGPGWRAPFDPQAPPLVSAPVDAVLLHREAAAALTRFLGHLLAVLDLLARTPVPLLRSGGVGARELTRLAKAAGGDEIETRLAVELAVALRLVEPGPDGLGAASALAGFRDADPGPRAAAVLACWWQLPLLPTDDRDERGKALPAGLATTECLECRTGRRSYLTVLDGCDGAVPLEQVAARATWRSPLGHGARRSGGAAYGAVADEAHRLGVVALGAVTELGRALVRDGDVAQVAAALLPEIAGRATFGSDLTAYATGTPAASLAALLDGAAVREGRGGAVQWRFSPASVRGALDDGADPDRLLEALSAVSTSPGELPQSLRVLVADVARRWGRVRVGPAASVLRIDDPALLAEIVGDRRVRALGLRAVSDTVLAASAEPAVVLARLRELGWFPAADGVVAPPAADRVGRGRAAPRRTDRVVEPDPDAAAVVAALRSAPDGQPEPSGTAGALGRAVPQLSASEVTVLAHALDRHLPVSITYRSGSGAVTERTVDSPTLSGGMLVAWCRLRRAERMFSLRGILAVDPV